MNRYFLFAVCSVIIILLLLNIISLNSIMSQNGRILDLENAVSGHLLEIRHLAGKSRILCTNSSLRSSGGKHYLELNALAGKDGKVSLNIQSVHKEPIFVINIREVLVVYDKKQDQFAADPRSVPTFKKPDSNTTCSGTIYPGESLTCESDYYSDVIEETVEDGDNAFIIRYLAAELDIEPYYFVGTDLCVRIV